MFLNVSSYNCYSVQFSSVTQLCLTLCDPMNHSTPGRPVHHQLLEFTQTHVHRVSDAIQPSHPPSPPSPPAPNPSQHQGLFQWVNSSHEVVISLKYWGKAGICWRKSLGFERLNLNVGSITSLAELPKESLVYND